MSIKRALKQSRRGLELEKPRPLAVPEPSLCRLWPSKNLRAKRPFKRNAESFGEGLQRYWAGAAGPDGAFIDQTHFLRTSPGSSGDIQNCQGDVSMT